MKLFSHSYFCKIIVTHIMDCTCMMFFLSNHKSQILFFYIPGLFSCQIPTTSPPVVNDSLVTLREIREQHETQSETRGVLINVILMETLMPVFISNGCIVCVKDASYLISVNVSVTHPSLQYWSDQTDEGTKLHLSNKPVLFYSIFSYSF